MTVTPGQMLNQTEETEDLARRLEGTGDYRVLRRLIARQPTPEPAGYTDEKLSVVGSIAREGL